MEHSEFEGNSNYCKESSIAYHEDKTTLTILNEKILEIQELVSKLQRNQDLRHFKNLNESTGNSTIHPQGENEAVNSEEAIKFGFDDDNSMDFQSEQTEHRMLQNVRPATHIENSAKNSNESFINLSQAINFGLDRETPFEFRTNYTIQKIENQVLRDKIALDSSNNSKDRWTNQIESMSQNYQKWTLQPRKKKHRNHEKTIIEQPSKSMEQAEVMKSINRSPTNSQIFQLYSHAGDVSFYSDVHGKPTKIKHVKIKDSSLKASEDGRSSKVKYMTNTMENRNKRCDDSISHVSQSQPVNGPILQPSLLNVDNYRKPRSQSSVCNRSHKYHKMNAIIERVEHWQNGANPWAFSDDDNYMRWKNIHFASQDSLGDNSYQIVHNNPEEIPQGSFHCSNYEFYQDRWMMKQPGWDYPDLSPINSTPNSEIQ